jgi:hypothetical protein
MATRHYQAIYNARRSGGLYAQAESFLLSNAIPSIQAEDPGTPNHAARLVWADATESSDSELDRQTKRLLISLVQNSTIAASVGSGQNAEDSDVEFVALGALDSLIAHFTPEA